MLNGKINKEELEDKEFWVRCITPPKSKCCTKGLDYLAHINPEAGHIYFMIRNDNNEPYLMNLSSKHADIEGTFEIVR